ncbi:hypothetical protein RFI_30409 [Reticulomyxa filosa]|uniref:Uncharacterized protein n=1 Tax=Reticulomyxa filosa TaxID=46433 RepID=X6LYJ2_RETFI|nr:hypothetical protein RFI_30409 [Reticulomyxa filosa]|eukprot:ETO06983.1 hypothetical protein RFI_30409 [Reticulomyxa filosa]
MTQNAKSNQDKSYGSDLNSTEYDFDDREFDSKQYEIPKIVRELHKCAYNVFYSKEVNTRFNALKSKHLCVKDEKHKEKMEETQSKLKEAVQSVMKKDESDDIFNTKEWKDCMKLLECCFTKGGKYEGCIHSCWHIIGADNITLKVKLKSDSLDKEFIQELHNCLSNLLLINGNLMKELSLNEKPQNEVELILMRFANKLKILIPQFPRNILNSELDYTITDCIDLFAHVRLFNLSQERQIKNLKDNPQNAAQKLDNKNKDGTVVDWRYIAFSNGTAVEEEQIIFLSSDARRDVVLFKKYPLKYSKIILQMKKLSISDSEMKQQLKSYPQHKMDFVDALTYLLFGTEVARNPGCILLHQMMLDLIESKQYTFEMFLDSGSMLMPMAMSGAVLQQGWHTQLFEKENHLIELWLKLKQKPEQFTEVIRGAISEWYGIS